MLADGSKFGDVALSTVVPIRRVSAIVTDASADPVEVERIAREGVEVIMAGPDGRGTPAAGPDSRPTDSGRRAPFAVAT